MSAIGKVINHLPTSCSLHLANSSTVRYAQLFPLPNDVEVLSNRGTNGIEGSLSTAIGYATASDKLNFIFIGDLSFFYDMNALWNANYGSNVRILLLNNEGEKYSMRFGTGNGRQQPTLHYGHSPHFRQSMGRRPGIPVSFCPQ